MIKINLTILSFMAIIFLSACAHFTTNTDDNILVVEKAGESLEQGIETVSTPTGFINE